MMEMREGREGEVFVSGAQLPVYEANAGSLERWRILNASPSRFYRLKLDGHQLVVIATDAARLASPRPVDELTLVPGERVEVLVRPSQAGAFSLRSLAVSRGSMGMAGGAMSNPEFELASLVVRGSAPSPSLPVALIPAEDLSLKQPDRTREVVFSMQGQMGGAAFLIDGKSFDPARVDISVKKDAVEDWLVRNTSPMDHPFHLHVWPFQVMESSEGLVATRPWKDTVNIPAGGWLRLRIPFNKITGKTVFHCHILDHEDMGMMAVVEVA
jgi:FtsP/CotA-like multicopper oxidase with cupredoxin domain